MTFASLTGAFDESYSDNQSIHSFWLCSFVTYHSERWAAIVIEVSRWIGEI
jgi:hypothetical protein